MCAGHGTVLAGVKIPVPGLNGAKGEKKGKGALQGRCSLMAFSFSRPARLVGRGVPLISRAR